MSKEKKELKIECIEKLQKMKIPDGWEIARLDVIFEKKNVSYPVDRQSVHYDPSHDCFYLDTTQGGYIYPEKVKGVKEGLEVMDRANNIIKNHE